MRKTSKVWKKLAARGLFSLEAYALINGKKYYEITAPNIDRQLMSDSLSVGNCCNGSCTLSVLTDDDIPKGAEVKIRARLFDGNKRSEYLNFGTFYVDSRDSNYEGLLDLTCYDAMKKADQVFVADNNYNTAGWPKAMSEVVPLIAQRLGVNVDPRTSIKTGTDYVVPFPDNGLTVRDVLSSIAAAHGGNWLITEDNALRLIPLTQSASETYRVIDADFNDIIVPNNNRLVWKSAANTEVATLATGSVARVNLSNSAVETFNIIDSRNNCIVTKDGYRLIWSTSGVFYVTNEILRVPVVLGELKNGTNVKVNAVSLAGDGEETYTAADNNITNGVTLKIENCRYATQNICNDLLTEFKGLVYSPYTATQCIFDPAAEIGDQVKIGDKVFSVIYNQTLILNTGMLCDLGLPAYEEQNSEYPYLTETEKLRDQNIKLQSKIERLDTSITLAVNAIDEQGETLEDHAAKLELIVTTSDGNDTLNGSNIVSAINASADTINLSGNRLIVDSTNFKLTSAGNVTITGAINATSFVYEDSNYKVQVADGISIKNKNSNIATGFYATNNSGNKDILMSHDMISINSSTGRGFLQLQGTTMVIDSQDGNIRLSTKNNPGATVDNIISRLEALES